MGRKINWFGFGAGITTLVMLVISLFEPWWQLTIGQNFIKINASPIYMNFGLSGSQFTIPLIWALNLITILTFTACGIVMLIYSLVPTKPYAKQLLGFSWKKPLYTVVGFAVALVVIVLVAGHFGLNIPLEGSSTLTVHGSWAMGISVSTLASGSFQLSFYFAIAGAALCLAARLYHGHILQPLIKPETNANPTATTATESLS